MIKFISEKEESIKAKRKELDNFLHKIRQSGEYPERIIECLVAHLMEGEPSTIVDSINYNETRGAKDMMYEILLKFALGYED